MSSFYNFVIYVTRNARVHELHAKSHGRAKWLGNFWNKLECSYSALGWMPQSFAPKISSRSSLHRP
eukprot:4853748-Amphidinium_carterae.1